MDSSLLRKEGKHHHFDDLEFWAEDGVICILDRRDSTATAITCRDFAKRAYVINEELKREKYASDRKRLQNGILDMHDVWKEAKSQGDPCAPKVVLARMKEAKRALLTPGIVW